MEIHFFYITTESVLLICKNLIKFYKWKNLSINFVKNSQFYFHNGKNLKFFILTFV